ARERPFVLEAPLHLVAALTDRELHRRLRHDAVVDAFEPVVEETQLIAPSVLGVERMHMRAGVDAKLLARRRRPHEGLGVPAQMQSHARPIADAEHRHLDLVPLRLRAAEGAAVESATRNAAYWSATCSDGAGTPDRRRGASSAPYSNSAWTG